MHRRNAECGGYQQMSWRGDGKLGQLKRRSLLEVSDSLLDGFTLRGASLSTAMLARWLAICPLNLCNPDLIVFVPLTLAHLLRGQVLNIGLPGGDSLIRRPV